MAVNLDASGIGQLVIRLELASEAQVRECLTELDDKKAPGEQMLRQLERKGYVTSWQGLKIRKGDTDGYHLGGYQLKYKIASGSFGRVYRAQDPRTGQTVAIKVLRHKWTMDKQKVELFIREGKLGMAIRHANIVSVLDVSQDTRTNQYYIVMEFVEGGNLRNIINIRKQIDIDESLRIMEECAAGLHGASQKGLTHRDIKPTNILISTQGQAKLVDFGLAGLTLGGGSVHLQRQKDQDEELAVDRTVDYAGLEKTTNAKPGDVRSDIYFLGTVLFEMVTGKPLLLVTKDKNARMSPLRFQQVEDTLARIGPEVGMPSALQKLIAHMVAFEPGERYQTAVELLEAVRHCRAELGAHASLDNKARSAAGPKTLFAVEPTDKLQDAFREKFKSHGFRVLISIDPAMAARRFREHPYHALIVDARTMLEEGVDAYNKVLREADSLGLDVGAILILGEKQANWARQAREHRNAAVLVEPITMKQLIEKVYELTPGDEAEQEPVAAENAEG